MAGRFNLSEYQTVKERKDLFKQDYPEGVVLPILITKPDDIEKEAAYIVPVWRSEKARQEGADRLAKAVAQCGDIDLRLAVLIMAPDAVGTAYENRSMTGASKTSWTENAEESAIGRALDNIGYHGNGKCSREEILKVKEVERIQNTGPEENPLGGEELPSYPHVTLPDLSRRSPRTNAMKAILGHAQVQGWSEEQFLAWLAERFPGKEFRELTTSQTQSLLDEIKGVKR